jgi:hypothetical protein
MKKLFPIIAEVVCGIYLAIKRRKAIEPLEKKQK